MRPAALPCALSCSVALCSATNRRLPSGDKPMPSTPWLLRRPVCGGTREPKAGLPSRCGRIAGGATITPCSWPFASK
ncbi:hypothetical protein G6F63_016486 [Rhizopus arrhizus]|nr:hypothetical protein G6F66_015179 [Rhizopus arrhizus]KAG1308225.1 hypothetical protein G6F63_016486 [Rhizopus arrhizus]KAG1373447.1 hypothetical protein G6F59_018498 [Rhizopus arrhizus]